MHEVNEFCLFTVFAKRCSRNEHLQQIIKFVNIIFIMLELKNSVVDKPLDQ